MLSSIKSSRLMLICSLLLLSLYMGSVAAQAPPASGLQTYYVSFKQATGGLPEGTGEFMYDPTAHNPTDAPASRQATLKIISWSLTPDLTGVEIPVTVDSVMQHDTDNQGASRVRGVSGDTGTGGLNAFSLQSTGSSRGTWQYTQLNLGTGNLDVVEEGVYLIRNELTVAGIPEPPVALLILAGMLPLSFLIRRRLRR